MINRVPDEIQGEKPVALKEKKKQTAKPISVRFSSEEIKRLASHAKKYTGGNVSKWVRFASINHVPRKRDLV